MINDAVIDDVLSLIIKNSNNYYCYILCKKWYNLMMPNSVICSKCHKIIKMYDSILWIKWMNKTRDEKCHQFYDTFEKYKEIELAISPYKDPLCLANIRQCNWLCLKMVQFNGFIIQSVLDIYQTEEVLIGAIKRNPEVIPFINEKKLTDNIFYQVVKGMPLYLRYIPEKYHTQNVCITALKYCGLLLQYIKPHDKNRILMYHTAIKNNGRALKYIPEEYITEKMCLKAVKQNGDALEFVPEKYQTYEICRHAVLSSKGSIKYINSDDMKISVVNLFDDYQKYLYRNSIISIKNNKK
jgi:hypothetical protein